MNIKHPKIKKLLELYKEISLLDHISATIHWDLSVNLPRKGAEERGLQLSYLSGVVTDKWLDQEFLGLINDDYSEKSFSSEERAILRNLKRGAKFYTRVPKKLIVEHSMLTTKAHGIWEDARKNNRFKEFAPILTKIVDLTKEIADHLGYKSNPYDALLDLYETELTAEETRKIFSAVQPELTVLVKSITTSKIYKKENSLSTKQKKYPVDMQKKLCEFLLKQLNYPLDEGRLDVSTHPFTTTLGRHDVRITTRYDEGDFRGSSYSTIHEAGHGLYELGINKEYSGTPLSGGVSLGIHESQSRFWENHVGRNPKFLAFVEPIYHALFTEQFKDVSLEDFVRYINNVQPSFIRTEADEVTYGLHIILRFELENQLMNNKVAVKDLPEVWNQKMKSYLGVVPPTDTLGVLQDVHWSSGLIGYFPTYLLGNLYASQFLSVMKKDIDFDHAVETGKLSPILNWLRKHVHVYGSMIFPKDLIKNVSGQSLNSSFYIKYLKDKYRQIYSLS